jgi:hypothetical protein
VIEFLPRVDRTASRIREDQRRHPDLNLPVPRLVDWPNTMTTASLERELRRRVESGTDPVDALSQLAESAKNWRRRAKPTGTGNVQVQFGGSGSTYVFEARQPVCIGDRVEVYTSIMGLTTGVVAAFGGEYDGPVSPIRQILRESAA